MTVRTLLVLTSNEWLGNTGVRTGAWLEELAAPFAVFTSRGWSVELGSPAGGSAPLDPQSLVEATLQQDGRALLKNAAAMASLRSTARLSDVPSGRYDVVLLVGGTGTAWDFPLDPDIRRLIEDVNVRNGIAGGLCHGVLGLGTATGQDGLTLLKGRRATGLSIAEDEIAGLDRIIPVLPEIWLRKAGAIFLAAAPFTPNVVIDGNFFTGQNPASARPLAEAIANAMADRRCGAS